MWGPLQCKAPVTTWLHAHETSPAVPTDISASSLVPIAGELRESLVHNEAKSTRVSFSRTTLKVTGFAACPPSKSQFKRLWGEDNGISYPEVAAKLILK